MDMQKTSAVLSSHGQRQQSTAPVPVVLRSLLCSLVVLALPQGAGVLLIALASSLRGALLSKT